MNKKREVNFLAVVLVFALLLRIKFSMEWPVWVDEANLVIEGAKHSILDLLLLRYWDTSHPPLFNILIKYWSYIGTQPLVLRIPSILASLASLIFLYKWVKLLFSSKLLAIITVALASFSGFMIGLSIFSRPYGIEQFFCLGFLYYWTRIVHLGEGTNRNLWFLFVFSLLATWTDYSFLWVLMVTHIMTVWSLWRVDKTRMLRILLLSIVPFLMWLPVFVIRLKSALNLEGYLLKDFPDHVFLSWGYLFRRYFHISSNLAYNGFLFTFSSMSIFWGLQAVKVRRGAISIPFLMLLLTMLPIVIATMFTRFGYPIALTKNLFICIYPIFIVVAVIVSVVFQKNTMLGMFMLAFLLGFEYQVTPVNIQSFTDQRYVRDILKLRKENVLSKATVVTDTSFDSVNLLKYYLSYYDEYGDLKKTYQSSQIQYFYDFVPSNLERFFLLTDLDSTRLLLQIKKTNAYECVKNELLTGTDLMGYLCTKKITPAI